MTVLILCTYENTYVTQTYKFLKKYYPNLQISLFTKTHAIEYYKNDVALCDDERIFSFGDHDYSCLIEARKLPHFDIIHSLWMEHFWGEAAHTLRSKCNAWLCSVGGSDLYRDSSKLFYRLFQKRIIRYASGFSSENTDTKNLFEKKYGDIADNKPHNIIPFGIDILEEFGRIDYSKISSIKAKYNIPDGKVVVMMGTNARTQQQHYKLLDSINKLDSKYREKICLLVPLTYSGTQDYIDAVISAVSKSDIESSILTRFMSAYEMAEIATCTDILIHVQTTDQLSSAMLANMYCGTVVIAGSWLPYQDLIDKGIKFLQVDSINEVTNRLASTIDELDSKKREYTSNKEIILNMSTWKISSKKWNDAYFEIIDEKNT